MEDPDTELQPTTEKMSPKCHIELCSFVQRLQFLGTCAVLLPDVHADQRRLALPTHGFGELMMEIGVATAVSAGLFDQLRAAFQRGELPPHRHRRTPCFVASSTQVIDQRCCCCPPLKIMRQALLSAVAGRPCEFPRLPPRYRHATRCSNSLPSLHKALLGSARERLLAHNPSTVASQNSDPYHFMNLLDRLLRRAPLTHFQQIASRTHFLSPKQSTTAPWLQSDSHPYPRSIPVSFRFLERGSVGPCSTQAFLPQPATRTTPSTNKGLPLVASIRICDQLVVRFFRRAAFDELADLGLAEPCDGNRPAFANRIGQSACPARVTA